ncbi:MAG: hypothetical protein Q7J47_03280 [Azoarcus sp.]|nr:hypothetical protein [Azoarcus sp.]
MTPIRINATDNLPVVLANLGALSSRHGPYILGTAINRTATKAAKAGNEALRAAIDRPIARTANAVKVFKGVSRADREAGRFEAVVNVYDGKPGMAATDSRVLSAGKSSVFPNRYLAAQIDGGRRVDKRFERALSKAGLLPAGLQAVFAKRSGYLNQYGNLDAGRIVQILAWFKAFPEVGSKANLTDASRTKATFGKLNKRTGVKSFGRGRQYGYSYFVSRGERSGGLGMRLPPGIWERNYPNGTAGKSFIKPVLLFVKPTTYRVRFPFYLVMQQAIDRTFPAELKAAADLALRTAR